MKETLKFWIATAGRHEARILLAETTPHGRLRVEPATVLEEDWDEVQHDRPSPRAGKDNHQYASEGHQSDERIHRFANRVGKWFAAELDSRDIENLHAFISPHLLGHLRKTLPRGIRDRLRFQTLDLVHLTPSELATHDAVLAVREDLAS